MASTSQPSGHTPDEFSYLDALAQELASDNCIRCSNYRGWKTAALIYESLEWKYYYCYDCRRWFTRHFKFRYAVLPVDDSTIGMLTNRIEFERQLFQARKEDVTWIKRKISASNRFFQRFLPF